jgi:flagellar biosynthetic protein FliR
VLVFFRTATMMLSAPLFGSARVPRIVKVLMALVLAMGIAPGVGMVSEPPTAWDMALAIGGEIIFGLALGWALSFTFIAVEWAGQIIGQQLGFNLGEALDPQFGASTSVVGDLYFMLALVVFLLIRGHHVLIRGLRDSFRTMPLLTVGMNRPLFDMLVGLLHSATLLAFRMSAPLLVTMLIVDLAIGFLGKTMPQFNLMSASVSLRSICGMLVLIIGLALTNETIRGALADSLESVQRVWQGLGSTS